jgi:CDP-6-deoxy-D-xylo-4-hexulose-3-dehydrase
MSSRSVRQYIRKRLHSAPKSSYRIPLAASPFTVQDIENCLDSLLSLKLTMGDKVRAFEERWAKYLGSKHCVMTSSGSSANLLALSAFSPIRGEIITSPLTFPTSVYPIAQIHCKPVFVDVEEDTLDLDPQLVEKAVTDKTVAILPVHFMGMPCAMKHIMEIARASDLYVIEDVSEAHGAKVNGKCAGTFGTEGTFSFFFSHHVSTIEGGAIVTDRDDVADSLRVLRSYGWVRGLKKETAESFKRIYRDIDPRHLYLDVGYNAKPTELNAALGIGQIERMENLIAQKQRIAKYLTDGLSALSGDVLLPIAEKDQRSNVYLGYPVIAKPGAPFDKFNMMNFLETHGIETRQLEAGDVTQQPSCSRYDYEIRGSLKNTRNAMRGGLFFGLGPQLSHSDQDYVIAVFERFFREQPWR